MPLVDWAGESVGDRLQRIAPALGPVKAFLLGDSRLHEDPHVPMPSFQGRPNSSLCVSTSLILLIELSSVSAPGGPMPGVGGLCLVLIHPGAGPGQGGLALYTTPQGCPAGLELGTPSRASAVCKPAPLGLLHSLGVCFGVWFLVSPDSAPRLPKATSGMFWEGGRRRWSAGAKDPVCAGK